ncbi:hypothetical protein ACH5RR_041790 [Cinchona calisaya]|uniref:Late blight resistance protein R1A-like N-terminal domain-containing protein n=1 Tax=Cinchona calisaya TaxID=153742 RepID=A0ABD2XVT3_9GENT
MKPLLLHAHVPVVYLEMELKRLRTFLTCTLGWCEYLLLKKSEVAVSLGSLLCRIRVALFILKRDFGSISQLENTPFVPVDTDRCFVLFGEIQKIFSRFRPTNLADRPVIYNMWYPFDENNKVLGQEVNGAYITFFNCSRKLTSPMRDVNELMEFIDTVLENLAGILNCCDDDVSASFGEAFHVRLQNLKVKLRSLKSFICFALFRAVERSQLESLLIHAEIFTLKAAHFLYMLWDYLMYETAYKNSEYEAVELNRDEMLQKLMFIDPFAVELKRDEMLQKIMFIDPFATEIHIQALQTLKASGSAHTLEMKNKEIARDFVDSLSDTIWILLADSARIEDIIDAVQELANKSDFRIAPDDKAKQNEQKDKNVSEQNEVEKTMKTLDRV